MSKRPAPKVATLPDLFALAWQIEADAVERYKMLADQMETHNNLELVKVFRDLARAVAAATGAFVNDDPVYLQSTAGVARWPERP